MIHVEPTQSTPVAPAPARNIRREMVDYMRAHPGCTDRELLLSFSQEEIDRHGQAAAEAAREASTRQLA